MSVAFQPYQQSTAQTVFFVDDLSKAKSFYLDTLGAELSRDNGDRLAEIQFLGNNILLVTPENGSEDAPAFFVPPRARDRRNRLSIQVKNCKATHRWLNARGASFITAPMRNGTATRCYFRDPDGHLIEICEHDA